MLHLVAADAVQPSSVYGAVAGRFRSSHTVDLLLVKHNVLELYEILPTAGGRRHRFISETRLNSPPISVATLATPASSSRSAEMVDRLVVLVSDIHVSVCKYDPVSRLMASEALFQLDDATEIPMQGAPVLPPMLRVDPLSRVMLVLSRRKYLFVIPITYPAAAAAAGTSSSGTAAAAAAAPLAAAAAVEEDTTWGDEDDDIPAEESSNTPTVLATTAAVAATITPTPTTAAAASMDAASLPILFGPVRLIPVVALGSVLRNIRDVQFLPTASSPTVAFLCEATPTWGGRVKLIDWGTGVQSNALSCAVSWFSIDMPSTSASSSSSNSNAKGASQHQLLSLGEVKNIPYNATALLPFSSLSDPAPAVICLAANSLHHVTVKRGSGFFFNSHGSEEGSSTKESAWRKITWLAAPPAGAQKIAGVPKVTPQQLSNARVNLNAAGAIATTLYAPASSGGAAPNKAILATEYGDVFQLSAAGDGRTVHGLALAYVGQTSHVSCLAHVPSAGVLFFGSASGDSHSFAVEDVAVKGVLGTPLQVFTCLGPILDADVVDCTTIDTELVTAAAAAAAAAANDGPARGQPSAANPYEALLQDLSVAPVAAKDALPVDPAAMDLLLCSGRDHTGALHVCRQTIRPRVALRQALDSVSVFFLDANAASKKRSRSSDDIDVPQHQDGEDPLSALGSRTAGPVLLVGTASATIVVSVGTRMMQVRQENTRLLTKQRTAYAAVSEAFAQPLLQQQLAAGAAAATAARPSALPALLLQVTENGVVQLMPANHQQVMARHDFGLGQGIRFATHDPATGHIFVVTHDQSLFVLFLAPIAPPLDGTSSTTPLLDSSRVELRKVAIAQNIASMAPLPSLVLPKLSPAADSNKYIVAVAATGELLIYGLRPSNSSAAVAAAVEYTLAGTITRFASFPTQMNAAFDVSSAAPSSDNDGVRAAPVTTAAPEPAAPSAKLAPLVAEPLPSVTELLAVRLARSDPQLASVDDAYISFFCLCMGELVVYALRFDAPDSNDGGVVQMNMIKLQTFTVDAEFKPEKVESIQEKQRRQQDASQQTVQDTTSVFANKSRRLATFDNVGGMSGVFVCGKRSRIVLSAGDRLVSHPMQQPPAGAGASVVGTIRGFSAIHSPLLERGFVVCGEGSLSFASLDASFDYSMPWATKRIPLGGRTPYHAIYAHNVRSVFATLAQTVPFRPRKAPFDVEMKVIVNEDGTSTSELLPQPEHPTVKANQGKPVPTVERYSVALLSVADWSVSDTLQLDENEQVLCSQLVQVNASAVVRGEPMPETLQLCAVGTGYPLGEDTPCRGRLLLLSASFPSTGSSAAASGGGGARKITILAKDETKGPVTAIASIRAHVAAAVGATIKLYRMDWDANRLVVSAFIYAGIYVPRMVVVKNFLVYGDIVQSCTLVRFNELSLSLQPLGRHSAAELSVFNLDVMYREKAFGIVATDADRRVVVLGYTPRTTADDGAANATSDSATANNNNTNSSSALANKPTAAAPKLKESMLTVDAEYKLPAGSICKTLRLTSGSGRPVLLYVTTSGAIGCFLSVSEQENRTLTYTGVKLVQELPHHAGLHPEAFLSSVASEVAATPREVILAKERVADGALLQRFAELSWTHRRQVAMTAMTKAARVMNVLLGLQQDATLF